MVTGFRVLSVAPKGECELQRALNTYIGLCKADNDDDSTLGRHVCGAMRRVFIVAFDVAEVLQHKEGEVVGSSEFSGVELG